MRTRRRLIKPGQVLRGLLSEADFSAAIYDYYVDIGEKFMAGEPIDLLEGDGTAVIRRSSLGPRGFVAEETALPLDRPGRKVTSIFLG